MNRNSLYILLAGLSFAGYVWLSWNVASDSATPTACMFKAVTHVPCPSCGTTRALVLLANGDVRGSLLVNPLGILIGLSLTIIPIWLVADTVRRSDSLFRWYGRLELLLARSKWLSIPLIALVLFNWIWNITKGL